jgi:hypothetical protein
MDNPDFNDVMRLARQWYYTEIRSLVDDAIARHDRADGREALQSDLEQTIDGHEFVIYTAKASMVLAASDCENAYEEIGLGDDVSTEVRAYFAMLADCWQTLDAREDEWSPSEESGEE